MILSERNHRNRYGEQPKRPVKRPKTRVPPQVLRAQGTPRGRKRTQVWLYLLSGLLGLSLLIPSVALGIGGVIYTRTASSLRPRLDKLASYQEQAFQTSRLYDRNGTLLYEFVNAGRRDPVTLDQVAPVLIAATIAIEDKTFFQNLGVDYLGILKAGYRNLVSGAEVSGASTITQQLIKQVILTSDEREHENRYQRKLTEIMLAQQIGEEYSKAEILELYLNEIPYGNLAYGIQAAAQSYFDVDASALTLNQASLLAGLPQLPTLYNPIQYLEDGRILKGIRLESGWLNPEARLPGEITPPRARQVAVLRQMVLNGDISERVARATIAEDLQFASQDVAIHAPHFVFHVKQVLEEDPIIGSLLANEGGLHITTTLDLRIQEIAQNEAARRIAELEQEQRNIHNAAVVAMQPKTGQILAMVGSVDYDRTKATATPGEVANVLDGKVNVTTRERQPGSALKPFTYLSGLVQGKLNAGSVLWDVETKFPIKEGATRENLDDEELWYGPENYDQKWHGPLRMRYALANSLNMPAVKALKRAGIQETLNLLHNVGITGLNQPPNYYGLALTLGGGEVTPLDLTTAYNTLADDGMYVPPTPILQITDRAGNVLPFSTGKSRQAVDPKYVALVRDFMGDNDARTPMFGRNNPLNLSRPTHAKTGTTEDFRDAWAVGFTPYITVGVWTGNNNNEKTARVESTVGGGVIWNRIMETLFKDPALDRLLRGPDLSVPLAFPDLKTYGLEERRICEIGGRFAPRETEWFVPGQVGIAEEQRDCDLYKTIQAVQGPEGDLCRPVQGVNYGDRLKTFKVWSLPPSTDEEVIIKPEWDGSTLEGSPIPAAPERLCTEAVASAPRTASQPAQPQPAPPQVAQPRPVQPAQPQPQQPAQPQPQQPAQPQPRPAPQQPAPAQPAPPQVAPPQPAPPPAPAPQPAPPPPAPEPAPPPQREPQGPTIPRLVGLGENQARGVLANLGITSVVVDYQGRDTLGDLFDQFPAYAVVSSTPGAGAPVSPGMTIILGIRAPE